jgi:tetratricopeptide (TPR) repeat protein
VILLAAVATFWAIPRLRGYQRQRATHAAERFLQLEDYRSAYLLLDRLVKQEPNNFETRRLLARVLDVIAPDQSLLEWQGLAKNEPGNPANHAGYATIALRTGRLDQLDAALTALRKLAPDGEDYHRLAVAAALARRDTPALRRALEGLVQANPRDRVSRFGLASMRLNSGDGAEAADARATLEEFARGDALRIRATLVLLNDVGRRWPDRSPGEAQRLLAQELGLGLDTHAGQKRYLWAGVKGQHEPGLQDIVQHMQAQPTLLPEDIAMLAGWMIERQQAREALVWIESLGSTLQTAPAVLNALAGCAVATAQWDKLEQVLLAGAWGPVPAEAVHYAFDARRERAAGRESKAESLWNNSMVVSESSVPGLRMLVQLAGHWRWERKLEQALWALVQRFPDEQDAWQKLSATALAANDSAKVWRVYSSWARANPGNRQVQVNRAVLGIFIRPSEPGLEGSIEEIARLEPDNPGSRLAQAMVCWRRHRWPEAKALLEGIPIKSSDEPRLALARGLVLASLGEAAAAEAAFAAIPPGVLLPEEAALLADARRRG